MSITTAKIASKITVEDIPLLSSASSFAAIQVATLLLIWPVLSTILSSTFSAKILTRPRLF